MLLPVGGAASCEGAPAQGGVQEAGQLRRTLRTKGRHVDLLGQPRPQASHTGGQCVRSDLGLGVSWERKGTCPLVTGNGETCAEASLRAESPRRRPGSEQGRRSGIRGGNGICEDQTRESRRVRAPGARRSGWRAGHSG